MEPQLHRIPTVWEDIMGGVRDCEFDFGRLVRFFDLGHLSVKMMLRLGSYKIPAPFSPQMSGLDVGNQDGLDWIEIGCIG